MKATSLHDYLEQRFEGYELISDDMIQEAKKEWRAIYLTEYSKQYRAQNVQISFRLPKSEYQRYVREAQKVGQKVTKYIKNIVMKANTSCDAETLHILVLTLMDTIEEAIHEEEILNASEVLLELEQIHTILDDCKNNKS